MNEKTPPRNALAARLDDLLRHSRAASACAALAIAGAGFLAAFLLASRHGVGGIGRPQGDLSGAIEAQEERLKANPDDISALLSLGELRFNSGESEYAEAINDLEQARDLGALDPKIFRMLGLMYQREGLYPFALKEYERYLRHFPDDKDIELRRAKLLYDSSKFTQAAEEYDALLSQAPSDPLIKENLALSLWKGKEEARAWRLFSELEAGRGPEAVRAAFFLGEISYEKRRYKNALTYLQAAQRGSGGGNLPGPGFEPGVLNRELAKTFQKLRRWKEAREYWKGYQALNPDDKSARAALRSLPRPKAKPRSKSPAGTHP